VSPGRHGREPGWLVDDHEVLVLVEDRGARLEVAVRGRGGISTAMRARLHLRRLAHDLAVDGTLPAR
jgi:hypothetical protein